MERRRVGGITSTPLRLGEARPGHGRQAGPSYLAGCQRNVTWERYALNILAEPVSCCSGVRLGEAAASRADGRNLKRNQRPQLGVSRPALREAPDIQNDSGTSGYPLREVGLAVDTLQ